jgi:hypothetical protein
MIDLGVVGIILAINQKNAFSLGKIEISQAYKSWSFVLTPLVLAACFLFEIRPSSPKNWAHFQDCILTLHTVCGSVWPSSQGVAAAR